MDWTGEEVMAKEEEGGGGAGGGRGEARSAKYRKWRETRGHKEMEVDGSAKQGATGEE